MARQKKERSKKIYVTGTKDRLYMKERYDGTWVLIDRRENYYASAEKPEGIYKQIDEYLEQGIVELR